MESRFCTYKRVGYLRERVAYELGIEFTGVIYAARRAKTYNKKTWKTV